MYERSGFKWTWTTSAWLALASLAILITVCLTAANTWAAPPVAGSSPSSAGKLGLESPTPTATTTCSLPYTVITSTGTIEPGTQDIGNHCDDCNTAITL